MKYNADQMKAQAMKQIIEVAAIDGIITDEEKKLIDLAEISLNILHTELKFALEDGIITADELDRLHDIKDRILNLSVDVAKDDLIISKDEMALLVAYIVAIKLPKDKK